MTDSTIDGNKLVFFDGWPEGRVLDEVPQDGFNGSKHHNVSAPAYAVGTKVRVWDDNSGSLGRKGWSTFIYLKLGTQNATTTVAAKALVVPENGTTPAADQYGIYRVTNDCDPTAQQATGCPMVALAIGAMTNSYYGWFQCGGTPGSNLVMSGTTYCLDGTFKTNGYVATGPVMVVGTNSGCMKLGPVAYRHFRGVAYEPCGQAYAADT